MGKGQGTHVGANTINKEMRRRVKGKCYLIRNRQRKTGNILSACNYLRTVNRGTRFVQSNKCDIRFSY